VIVDDEPVRSCLMFAVQADGAEIRTVEGLADGDAFHPLQRAFMAHHALQCGFCTPGFVVTGAHLFAADPHPDEATIREAFSGNICRCTGYGALLRAFSALAEDES